MVITATEFKTNLGKYLGLIAKEDIYITKNGKVIAKMSNPNVDPVEAMSGVLEGELPQDFDILDIREARLRKHESID